MKAVKKKLRKKLHPVSADEIKTFFSSQLDHTYRLLSARNFSRQLDERRKMLKHLMYNEHIVYNGLGKDLNIDFDYIDELQEVLGQWHNNKLMMAFFSNKKFNNKDIDSMKTKNEKLEKVITDKASSFKKKINADNA